MRNEKKSKKNGNIIAKILLYDSWRERIIYKVQATQNDKNTGLMIIERLKNLFGISTNDEKKFIRDSIKWSRDDKGKIVSPYSKRLEKE